MPSRLLILETSQRVGQVALALGETLVGQQALDEARRHARDLVPATQTLLQQQGWRAADLDGVFVSRGPGSYTGLRVGLMSAKMLAYATGCLLMAIDTFEVIYRQIPEIVLREYPSVEVISDAQQDKVYVQCYGQQQRPLAILPLGVWMEQAAARKSVVTGPGLETYAARLPSALPFLPKAHWLPQPEGLLRVGWLRWQAGQRDDPFTVEPLYLRPSSAEENWPVAKR